jgi:hypothetical protein
MASKDRAFSNIRLDADTVALLIEAASVVGRPLDGTLRYRLILKARSCESAQREAYKPQGQHDGAGSSSRLTISQHTNKASRH